MYALLPIHVLQFHQLCHFYDFQLLHFWPQNHAKSLWLLIMCFECVPHLTCFLKGFMFYSWFSLIFMLIFRSVIYSIYRWWSFLVCFGCVKLGFSRVYTTTFWKTFDFPVFPPTIQWCRFMVIYVHFISLQSY